MKAISDADMMKGTMLPPFAGSLLMRFVVATAESKAAEKPFFAFVSHHGIHTTLEARPASLARFKAKAPGKQHSNPLYAACLFDLDDGVGQLLARIKAILAGPGRETLAALVAQDKAVSAAMYRRSTKVFQDLITGGGVGLRAFNLRGASTVEGGLTLMLDGKVIGGIGVSGVNSDQDGVVAKAGVDAVAAR